MEIFSPPPRNAKKQGTTVGGPNYQCGACGKLFKRARKWMSHIETHNSERKNTSPCRAISRQSFDESHDQLGLEASQRMTPVDPSPGSPATSIYYSSPETASSNDTSLCADSDESSSLLEDKHSHLVVLHSKHMLLVDLMQEVYAIFDERWAAKIQTHAGPSPSITSSSNQNTTSDSSRKDNKRRCRDDRDSTPPNDGESKKKPSGEISSNVEKQNNPFACPFHKNEPTKYCCSVVDGSKYRACVGPGFASISYLK